MSKAINVKNLVKSYGNNQVIKGISFHVEKGEIFGFLGTNGAGKTTTLECLEGLRRFDSGQINIQGKTGVQLQNASLPEQIRPLEALKLYSQWKHVPTDMSLVKRFSLNEFTKQYYSQLSTGQKRRLHLALAMIGDPDIIFLDEPTAGLDVEGRAAIHEQLRQLKSRGKTVIMASHDMSEVEHLCDRISILKGGKIAFCGTAAELATHMGNQGRIHLKTAATLDIGNIPHAVKEDTDQNSYIIESDDLTGGLACITNEAIRQNIKITELTTERTSLEEKFLDIAKEAAI